VALEVAHARGVLHAWEAAHVLGGCVGWVSAVSHEVEEVVVCGLPLAREVLAHAGDGVSSKGKGHDPCSIDRAREDGQAGLIGEVTGFEDGGSWWRAWMAWGWCVGDE